MRALTADLIKQKKESLSLKTWDLNGMLDVYTETYRTFHPKSAEYSFFSSANETFPMIDHMLGHKTSLNKLKKTEIISGIFSDHMGMKLEINYKKKTGKFTNM